MKHKKYNINKIFRLSLGFVAVFIGAVFIINNSSLLKNLPGLILPDENKPNIVLILTDDQRWDTYQNMPLTKQLIGDKGITFTNAFASTPLCCPSRASILTGLYVHNHKIIDNGPGAKLFRQNLGDKSTIAVWLQAAGYRTALIGKYLNQYEDIAPYIPDGWNDWHAFKNIGYKSYSLINNGVEQSYLQATQGDGIYSTTKLAELSKNFIENTPTDQPFFLYFAPYAAHSGATPEYTSDQNLFRNLPAWRPPSFNEADVSDKPLWVRNLPLLTSGQINAVTTFRKSQLASLQSVDRAVKTIIDTLERTGRLNNTIIIFASDQGISWGEHRWERKKNCVYEECIRMPFVVRAPGVTPRIDDRFVMNIDIAPTIAAYAGITPPRQVNGVSLKPLIENEPVIDWRDSILLEVLAGPGGTYNKFSAIRTSNYLYAEYKNGDKEFYNLSLDPYQLGSNTNTPVNQSIISDLKARLDILKAQ